MVAGLGVVGTIVGTIAGVLITQRRSDRRELSSWAREREREREHWAREDALRTFEQRRDAYVAFYEALRVMERTAYDHGMGLSDPEELDFEWNMDAAKRLHHLQLYASPEVMAVASPAYDACWRWGHYATHGTDDDAFYQRKEEYDTAQLALYQAIRRDLGVTPTAPGGGPLPGSGWEPDGDP